MTQEAGGPRALAVDDEEHVRELVKRTLAKAGWEIDLAADGPTALSKVSEQAFDVVLLDVRMPGMGGFEVLERLRSGPRPPAVVALTALGDYKTFADLVRGGAAAYLSKPFSPQDLVDLCERVRRAARQPLEARDERRRDRRRDIIVGVKVVTAPERGSVALGVLANFSRGGAQVDLLTPLELGRQVRVSLHVGVANVPLSFQGQVRWRVGVERGFAHGIAFSSLEPALEARLIELLETRA